VRLAGKSVILAVGAMALAAASPAGAKVARTASFTLTGTHGYRIQFQATGRGSVFFFGKDREKRSLLPKDAMARAAAPKRGVNQVSIDVAKRGADSSYEDESGDARFTPRGFSGSIGDLGEVDVVFHERSHHRVAFPPGICSGHLERRTGWFTGRISFHGEHGYTKLDAARARGHVDVPHHLRCHLKADRDKQARNVELDAVKRTRDRRFETFLASLASDGRFSVGLTLAGRIENKPDYSVFRTALLLTQKPILTYRQDLSRARLRASAHSPLMGTAKFVAPRTWTGPLSVSLPGRPHIRLTGDRFHAKLKRVRGG
jgi:hypothetical protein